MTNMVWPTEFSSFLAADPNALARSMRASTKSEKDGGLKVAAQQFEAIFLDLMLKNMRATKFADSEFDGPGTNEFTHMLDQQLTSKLSHSGTFGLADMLVRQLTSHNTARPQLAMPVAPVKKPLSMP